MDARTIEKPVDISSTLASQRQFFRSRQTRPYEFRLAQLEKLKRLIQENENAFCEALKMDLGKHSTEAKFTEIRFIISEIDVTISNLKKWMQKQKVSSPLFMFGGNSYRLPEPKGCVFIVGPWNYPFQLVIGPLVGAIAAGNCAIIKPSEMTRHTTALILKLINDNFDPSYIHAIDVMPEDMAGVLKNKFDHIFFTGGTRVAKIIAHAAADHLTPTTLELGGKSPCIVDETANLDFAARKIIFAKMLNAGQTCIAPDYVYVHESVKDALMQRMREVVTRFYTEHPEQSESLGRIVTEAHFERLQNLLAGANVIAGGQTNPATRYIAPTILDNVTWDDPVMHEEIFGPILPVLTYKNVDEIVDLLADKPKSLALYLFSKNHPTVIQVLEGVSFGGGCVNDCLMQAVNPNLPFGGIGDSGSGAYHGKTSFDAFTHMKSIYQRWFQLDFDFMYPPYNEAKEKKLGFVM